MSKPLLILGPNPFNDKINHSGGQLTAIKNLVDYMDQQNKQYTIIDTFRSTFPPQSTFQKLLSSISKYKELKMLLDQKEFSGAIVFVSYGFGYWEKMLFSLMIENRGVKTLFFIRSGHFMTAVKKKNYKVPIKKYLMNKLSYIGYQGGDWKVFYERIGIKEQKMIKVLNWIEIYDYKKVFKEQKVTFLYVGWMVKEKGVKELLDVILKHSDLDQFQFIFVGGGTLLEELQLKSRERNNILFTGWLEKSDVIEYYKKADSLILPSHAEGFPNVILESLNYRLPIISTNVGAISESVIDGYNGFLIEVEDKNSLYDSILKLGSSNELRQKFSLNSEKILFENHSIENNCQKIFNIFNI